MSIIRSTDDPVKRMAMLMAALYVHMARELISQLGQEKGSQAIRDAIKSFAEQRVASMLKEAKERGLDINAETYTLVRDMPGDAWIKDPDHPEDIIYCPMYEMWQHMNAGELPKLYCEIDWHLMEPFNTKLERPLCLTCGDDRCRFLLARQ